MKCVKIWNRTFNCIALRVLRKKERFIYERINNAHMTVKA